MTDTRVKYVFDCATGEESYIPLTQQEIDDIDAQAERARADEEARNIADAAAEATRESARAKLAALGLTEAEVAALVK
jgi:hypothetical protein